MCVINGSKISWHSFNNHVGIGSKLQDFDADSFMSFRISFSVAGTKNDNSGGQDVSGTDGDVGVSGVGGLLGECLS
jgi:hypothetical protein